MPASDALDGDVMGPDDFEPVPERPECSQCRCDLGGDYAFVTDEGDLLCMNCEGMRDDG